jgi:hypothetical protein
LARAVSWSGSFRARALSSHHLASAGGNYVFPVWATFAKLQQACSAFKRSGCRSPNGSTLWLFFLRCVVLCFSRLRLRTPATSRSACRCNAAVVCSECTAYNRCRSLIECITLNLHAPFVWLSDLNACPANKRACRVT